jgi:putative nucleotidyltransferase with HDIG domain
MGIMQIAELHLAPSNVEETLHRILDDLDLPRVEARTGLRLSELVPRLREYRHNQDQFHQGETILEHIQMVLEDLERITVGLGYPDRQLLNATALFHDLGKAYTRTVEDGRFKYHRHAEVSGLVYDALMAQETSQEFFLIRDLVRLHDVFLDLARARREATGGSLRYLNRLMTEPLVQQGRLYLLLHFVQADTARAQQDNASARSLQRVLSDIESYQIRQAEEVELRRRMQERAVTHADAIRDLVQEVPEAAAVLPNISAMNEILGRVRRYDLIRATQAILQGSPT